MHIIAKIIPISLFQTVVNFPSKPFSPPSETAQVSQQRYFLGGVILNIDLILGDVMVNIDQSPSQSAQSANMLS